MRRLSVGRTIDAPAESVWRLLTDVDAWPRWGPSVTAAALDDGDRLTLGATGRLRVVGGLEVRFEITELTPGRSWSWRVGGVPATDHEVVALDEDRGRARIGVPLVAAPYLAVCQVGLRRLDRLARS